GRQCGPGQGRKRSLGPGRAGARPSGRQEGAGFVPPGRDREGSRMRLLSASVAERAAASLAVILLGCATSAFAAESGPSPAKSQAASAAVKDRLSADPAAQELFRGKVVMLKDALARRKIKANEEFDKQVVLETAGGELIPIVPDWRGRAFF